MILLKMHYVCHVDVELCVPRVCHYSCCHVTTLIATYHTHMYVHQPIQPKHIYSCIFTPMCTYIDIYMSMQTFAQHI